MTDQTRQPQPRPSIAAIEALLRDDARFEPPAAAFALALALRSRIAARGVASPSILAKVGDLMDLAGARVVQQLGPAAHDEGAAAAGVLARPLGETVLHQPGGGLVEQGAARADFLQHGGARLGQGAALHAGVEVVAGFQK